MNKIIFQIQQEPDGGYTAQAVGHSIFTQANSLAELHLAIQDAIDCHFD